MPTHPSRIDIPAATRDRVIAVMNARLAHGIDLMLQAKQAHWNAKGPWFATLHALFDMVNATTAEHVDLLAEISRANDKLLWLLEAHLQSTGAAPVAAPSTVAPRAMAVPA